jgi:histone-binding protein RBBP4
MEDANGSYSDIHFSEHDGEVTGMSWNVQIMGKLVTCSSKGDVKLFDVTKYNSDFHYLDHSQTWESDKSGTNSIKWVPSHDSLFLTANESNHFKLFDTRSTNEPITSGIHHSGGVNSLSINPHNPYILSTGDGQGTLNIWDIRSSDSPLLTHESIHKGSITCLEFDPNRPDILASGSDDATVQIYDLAKNKLIFRHGGHILGVNDISWNAHVVGMLASVANDNTLQVWIADV